MHKMNRIGPAIISTVNRSSTTPALAYSGSSITAVDTTAQILDLVNGAEDGVTIDGVATGSFTHTTLTAQAFGQHMQIDTDYGNSIGIECWGLLQYTGPSNAIALPIAGHLPALATSVSGLLTVSDIVPLDDPEVPSISSTTVIGRWHRYHATFVARRTSAVPFTLFHGLRLMNPGADAASCNIRAYAFGYRTLADQNNGYYDPAR